MAEGTTKLTRADLEAMVRDIVGKSLSDLQEQNRSWVKDLFAAQAEAQAEAAQAKRRGKGEMAGRWVRALAAGKGDPERAARYAKQVWRDEALSKQLAESFLADGGAIVPDEYMAELIELLRAQAVVRQLGATTVNMASGSMTIPKQTGASTARYIGENTNIPASQPTFGQIQLSAKKLAALVPISNDLLRDSSPSADQIVRDDLVAVMALREDLAFIRGDGTNDTPKGLLHWSDPTHVFNAQSDSLDHITEDAAKAIRLIEEANVPMLRMGWIFTPRTKWYLMALRDLNGNLVFEPELRQGTWFGIPFRTTTQIPNNLGGGGDESEIYLADFSQAIIGENLSLSIDVSSEASWWDGGNLRGAFSEDQTVIRAIARHDFAVRHQEAISIITAVDYGAN